MPLFSERHGYRRARKEMQLESMDESLRNRLWNATYRFYWDHIRSDSMAPLRYQTIAHAVWTEVLNEPIDEMPGTRGGFIKEMKRRFYSMPWYMVYDLLEFLPKLQTPFGKHDHRFIDHCNSELEAECAGYRFVGKYITPITSGLEIASIEEAQNREGPLAHVSDHLDEALAKLSDRKNPDYRNSIKESISAVEAMCRHILDDDDATLGEALKVFDKKIPIHGALKGAFSALYGYTSDAHGIRHSLIEGEREPTFDEAKFMLVVCSAFVNYLVGVMKDA